MNLNSGESLILGGSLKTIIQRRSAGVVERAALEMRCTGNGTGGSNPSFSAFNRRSFSAGGLLSPKPQGRRRASLLNNLLDKDKP